MQTLVLKNKHGVAIVRKEFESDREARIDMENSNILTLGYFYEMGDKSKSNLCMIDFLEKILKCVVYNLDYEEMSNEEIKQYLIDKLANATRLTCEEVKTLIELIEILYPCE